MRLFWMLWHPSYVKKLITDMAEEEVSMLLGVSP
jgi:hypothetical protein